MTPTMKNSLATAYGAAATHAMIYTTVPSSTTQGTEVAGATHQAITWSSAGAVGPAGSTLQPATPGVVYAQVQFSVNSGQTVAGAGVHSSATTNAGFLDGGSVTSQPFNTAGTYLLNLSYTQQ